MRTRVGMAAARERQRGGQGARGRITLAKTASVLDHFSGRVLATLRKR
jgi:hypothetical protein